MSDDSEIAAMAALAKLLEGLDEAARFRALNWANSKYGRLAGREVGGTARAVNEGKRLTSMVWSYWRSPSLLNGDDRKKLSRLAPERPASSLAAL